MGEEEIMGGAAKRAHQFWTKQIDIIREKGILGDDEEVEAMVGLFKRSQLVYLAGILARFLQNQYLLIVTDQRVLLVHIPAFMVHGSGYHEYVEVPRPCRLELPEEPRDEYFVGVKVDLPDAFASLVGRPFAYVVFGVIAQEAFDRAGKRGRRASVVPTNQPEVKPAPRAADDFLRFPCPACGKALKVQRALAGRRVKCSSRTCGQSVRAPTT